MPITGIFTRSTPTIGGLVFDAVLQESDELRTDVTQFAIEDGSIGNDFAITQNQTFSMVVAVSDNPARALSAEVSQTSILQSVRDSGLSQSSISAIVSGSAGYGAGVLLGGLNSTTAALAGLGASIAQASYASGQAMTRSGTVLENIRRIQRNNTIFTLTTSKGTFPNCIITNTRRETDVKNEKGLELVVEMQQLRIMSAETRARFLGFENAGIPVQGGDTATTMAQGRNRVGFTQALELR